MADIYRYEWTSTRNGDNPHRYRLDIAAPGASALSGSPIVTDLQDDAIKEHTAEWEFDELPIGLASPPRHTIRFAVNNLPTALVSALMAEPVTLTTTLNADLGASYQTTVDVLVGCNLALYVSDPTSSPSYKLIHLAVQDDSTIVRPDLSDGTMETQWVDAWQAAGKAISPLQCGQADYLWASALHATKVVERDGVWDVLYQDILDSEWKGIAHMANAGGGTLWAVSRNDLWDRWEHHTEAVLNKMVRRPVALFQRRGMTSGMGNPREQRYHPQETWPSGTTPSTIYMVPFIMDGAGASAEPIYTVYEDLERNYPAMYDVVVDTLGQWVRPAAIRYAGTYGASYVCTLSAWEALTVSGGATTIDLIERARDAKPALNDRRVRIGESSWEFAEGDDYDKMTWGTGGRNDKPRTVDVLWNWSPSASNDLQKIPGGSAFYPSGFLGGANANYVYWDYRVPLFAFYYLSNAGGGLSSQQLIRCASWWPGDGSTAPTTDVHDWSWTNASNLAVAAAIADQQDTGVMIQTAKYVSTLFGAWGATLSIGVGSEDVMPWHDDRLVFNAYQSFDYVTQMDLSTLRTWLASAPTTWHPVKISESLTTGLAEVEYYGQ